MSDRQIRVLRTDILSPSGAAQWLVLDEQTGQHYIVSGVHAMFTGWEVLVFEADADGAVTDWMEVAGGKGLTHEQAIEDLGERLGEEATA